MSQESAFDTTIADELTEPPKGNSYITYAIMTVNVFIFIAMLTTGFQLFPARSFEVLRLGASAPAITFGGEWWRIIMSMFVHSSLLHLVVNMTTLFFIGTFLEPVLGKARFILAYTSTGIAAALASALWYIDHDMIYTGSSGAIAGLTGVFLVLAITKVIPERLKYLLKTVLIFAGFTIFFAVKPDSGIDNAALSGGFLCGIVIGAVYYFTFRKPSFVKTLVITSVMVIAFISGIVVTIQKERSASMGIDYKAERFYNKAERKKREDDDKFQRLVKHFDILQDIAIEAMESTDTTDKERHAANLDRTAFKNWVECVNLMDEGAKLVLTAEMENVRLTLREYANHRIQETLLLIKSASENTYKYSHAIDSIQQLIMGMHMPVPPEDQDNYYEYREEWNKDQLPGYRLPPIHNNL
jgi:rhomboid protease GluP